MNFPARHPLSILALFLGVLLYGGISLSRIPLERMPRVYIPEALAVCEYPGLPAEEMETLITLPLEKTLSGVSGVTGIRSVTRQGISRVTLRFGWDSRRIDKAVLVREAADRVYPSLPDGTGRPFVDFQEADGVPFMELVFYPAPGAEGTSAEIMRREVLPRFRRLPGAASIRALGIPEQEIKIAADMEKLTSLGITTEHLSRAVSEHILTLPLGKIEGALEHRVIASTDTRSLEDLRKIPVPLPSGFITVGDCAEVFRDTADPSSLYCVNSRQAFGILLYKAPGFGPAELSRGVQREMEKVQTDFEDLLSGNILYDGTDEVSAGLRSVVLAMVFASAAAVLIIFLVYRDPAGGFIIGINIPASLFLVFPVMDLLSMELNTLSLLGMALGTGMVVDNAVVVLERILETRASAPEDVSRAAAEAAGTAFGSTLSTVLVFLPVMLIPGIMGALFRDLVLSITVFLAGSFVWSVTLTPAMYTLLIIRRRKTPPRFSLPGLLEGFFRWTDPLQKHPAAAAAFLTLLAAAGFLLLPGKGFTLFPGRVSRFIECTLDIDPALPADGVADLLQSLPVPPASWFRAFSGYDTGSFLDKSSPEGSLHRVRGLVKTPGDCTAEDARRLADDLFATGQFLRVTARLRQTGLERLLGDTTSATLVVSAESREEAEEETARRIKSIRDTRPGVTVVPVQEKLLRTAELRLDTDKMAASGSDPASVLRTLGNNIRGKKAAALQEEGRRTDIRILLREDQREGIDDILEHSIPAGAELLRLKEIGSFYPEGTYPYLLRVDRSPAFELEVTGETGSGYRSREARHIPQILAAALLLMYLCLVFQFESFSAPLLMLTILPAGSAGSVIALAAAGLTVNLYSGLGVLIMTGTSLNMIIMMSAGMKETGSPRRAFPGIFTSTMTTLCALIPLFFLGDGPDIPAAMTGGLLVSMVYALAVYPHLCSRVRQ